MLITSKEIKTYPNVYLEELLLKKPENSLLYQYAPYLIMTSSSDLSKYRNMVSYSDNPVMKTLLDIAHLMKVCFASNKIGFMKSEIINVMRSLPSDPTLKIYTSTVRDNAEALLKNIKDTQYEGKLLESALLNYSPIVPYSKILKAPGMTSVDNTNKINPTQISNNLLDIISSIMCYENTYIEETIHTGLLMNAIDILGRYDGFIRPDIFDIEYNIKPDPDCCNSLSSDIIPLLLKSSVDAVDVYYLCVYLYYTFDLNDIPVILNTLKSINTMTKGDINVVTAMETMLKVGLPALEDSIFAPDSVTSMKYEQDKKLELIMGMANIEPEDMSSKNYNLDKLLSFIYNSRRYKTDSYTNSLFLNDNNSIAGYSYFENGNEFILVCEIDDKALAIPVMDLSDNYKMKLVTMDKSGNIIVTTSFKST